MIYNNVIIIILTTLLLISLVNYYWLLNDIQTSDKNYLYIKNLNQNKYKNLNIVTYSYIYPKTWKVDKCYSNGCDQNDNMFETKIKLFHNELYALGNNKKILILKNDYNISPITINLDDLKMISTIDKQ